MARFGEIGADVPPGTTYSYSNPGFNSLGAVVEVTSGMLLDAFFRERIYKPLGMRDTSNHESHADNDRMSTVYSRDDSGEWKVEWEAGRGTGLSFRAGVGRHDLDSSRLCPVL